MCKYIVHHDGLRVAEGTTRESTLAWVAEQKVPSEFTAYEYIGGTPSNPDSWKTIAA